MQIANCARSKAIQLKSRREVQVTIFDWLYLEDPTEQVTHFVSKKYLLE